MNSIRIKHLLLKDVGPFSDLEIDFAYSSGISLICGDNGIGKTTILESIAACFAELGTQRLKKKADSDFGKIKIDIEIDGNPTSGETTLKAFNPDESDIYRILPQFSQSVINVRATRDFQYTKRDSISRDPNSDPKDWAKRVGSGLNTDEIKQWFSNRYLMAPHADGGGWTPSMRQNLKLATNLFSVLDPTVSLHSVNVTTFNIIVDTPSGQIPFEYLSSGFRSAYVLLLGILKEIEFRGLKIAASDFCGVIIIDELDLHLHPTWQRTIAKSLTTAFPQAQIIATTHSPHVIQAAQASEVIALTRTSGGRVQHRELPSTKFGYAGWTLDEVLEDVMGVQDTKSEQYKIAVALFDHAIESEDADQLQSALAILREMLHPNNPYRKLIELQAAPVIGNKE